MLTLLKISFIAGLGVALAVGCVGLLAYGILVLMAIER